MSEQVVMDKPSPARNRRKPVPILFASAMTTALMGSTVLPAMAATGGSGGMPGGNWGGSYALDVKTLWYDNVTGSGSDQGAGQESAQWFMDQAGLSTGPTNTGGYMRNSLRQSCNTALAEATQRGRAEAISKGVDPDSVRSRVVGIMYATANDSNGGPASRGRQYFDQRVSEWIQGRWQGFYGLSRTQGIPSVADQLARAGIGKAVDGGGNLVSSVCVALNDMEPRVNLTPAIRVENWNADQSSIAGDRDKPEQALTVPGTSINMGYRVYNTGDAPLTGIKLTPNVRGITAATVVHPQVLHVETVGGGTRSWDSDRTLHPGERLLFEPTSFGPFKPGESFADIVSVEGFYNGQRVTDTDPWYGRTMAEEAEEPPPPLPPEPEPEPEPEPIPEPYTLRVTTQHTGGFSMAGSSGPVSDNIYTAKTLQNEIDIRENVSARVILNYDGPAGEPGSKKSVTKSAVLPNSGTTRSPNFTPTDFGWTTWPSGKFWFDIQVSRQGMMASSVNTQDRLASESWDSRPVPPSKIVTTGGTTNHISNTQVLAAGQMYDARVSAHSNGYSEMVISDKISTDKVWIGSKEADDISKLQMLDPQGSVVNGADFTINRDKAGEVTVSGRARGLTNHGTYTLIVPTYVLPTGEAYNVPDGSDVCYTSGSAYCMNGDDKVVRKVSPTPDKVWVLDEEGALSAADPEHTNQQGADNKVFLPGDDVAAVVNGSIHAGLVDDLENYQIIDDWTKAADFVDFSDASRAKVFLDGQDVTSQFTIEVDGTRTIATAKPEFLAGTGNRSTEAQIKLVISGNFRADYDTDAATVELHNEGRELWNNEVVETNVPPVFTWTPDPNKQIIGSDDEQGERTHDSIEGLQVWPGQKIEYAVQVDLRVPENTARGVKSLAVRDNYDPNFVPDKRTIEFYDTRNQRAVPRSAYELTFDDANHSFTATFTDEWLAQNVEQQGFNSEWLDTGWLILRFDGVIRDGVPGNTVVKNQAFQIINDIAFPTPIPEVSVPFVEPDKEDLNTDLVDIDGKTVVQGDTILYRLTLDGGPARSELAYDVHKLGMVDDFDEEYLDVEASAIRVTDKNTGEDVTDKFNIQVKDGKAYIFAKTVGYTNIYGEQVVGDPQPDDLAAYDASEIVPHKSPRIDQSLLGRDFYITMPGVVSQEVDGYVIENRARQNIQNQYLETKIVSNPLKDIDPSKDITVEAGEGDSIDGTVITLHDMFNYKLNSSVIPGNRAYEASQWSITDTFDREFDFYTGTWAIHAGEDLYRGQEKIASAGDLLVNSSGSGIEGNSDLFEVTFDEESYTLSVVAEDGYFDLVNSRGDLPAAFSVYTQMERIKPGDNIANVHTERYNEVDRGSNEVVTSTPEHPSVEVVKYTVEEGPVAGDRNDPADPYYLTRLDDPEAVKVIAEMKKDAQEKAADVERHPDVFIGDATTLAALPEPTREEIANDSLNSAHMPELVGVRITNTGDVALHKLSAEDVTIDGTTGSLVDLMFDVPLTDEDMQALYPDGVPSGTPTPTKKVPLEEVTRFEPGATLNGYGLLVGVEPGTLHTNNITINAHSVYTDRQVTDEDPWSSVLEGAPAIDVEKFTTAEGLEIGDRDKAEEALALGEDHATDGTQITFRVTNTGDVPLQNVSLEDTITSGSGRLENHTCEAENQEGGQGDDEPGETIEFPVTPGGEIGNPDSGNSGPGDTGEVPDSVDQPEQDTASEDVVTTSSVVIGSLAPGESIDCLGTLKGVEPGETHANTATVKGETVPGFFEVTQVTDEDDWNAKRSPDPVPGKEEGPRKGAVTGEAFGERNPLAILLGSVLAMLGLTGGGYAISRNRKNVSQD